jgi:hypothetical protein
VAEIVSEEVKRERERKILSNNKKKKLKEKDCNV